MYMCIYMYICVYIYIYTYVFVTYQPGGRQPAPDLLRGAAPNDNDKY